MKTKTLTATSAEQLDQEIENTINSFPEQQKKNYSQIGIININFSTHTENGCPVFCAQIVYIEQSKFAINPTRPQA